MAEPQRRSALEGHLNPGHLGLPGNEGVSLRELRPHAMAQVHALVDPQAVAAALEEIGLHGGFAPLRCTGEGDLRALWNGPGQYLVVSGRELAPSLSAVLNEAIGSAGAAAVDVSHARTVLRLAGPACRDVLAKGCPLDVDDMGPGDCAATVISHFNVLVHCHAEQAFDLYVTRSFALAFLEWLLHAAAEYGVHVKA